MKKIISIILAAALMMAAIPAFGAEEQTAPLAGRTSDMKRIGDSSLLWSMDALNNFMLYDRSFDGRSVIFCDIGEVLGDGGVVSIYITDAEKSDISREDEFYDTLYDLSLSAAVSAADLIIDEYGNEAYRLVYKEQGTEIECGCALYKVWANGYIYEVEAVVNLDKFSLKATAAQIETFAPVFGDSVETYDLAADPDTTFNKFSSAYLGISFDIPLYINANDTASAPNIIVLYSQKPKDDTEIYISICSLSDTVNAQVLANQIHDFKYVRSNHDCVEMSEAKPVGDVSYGENAFEYALTYTASSGKTQMEYTQIFEKGDYCYLINIMYDDTSALLPETVMSSLATTDVDSEKVGYIIPANIAAYYPEDVTYTVDYEDGKSLTVPRTWRYGAGYLTESFGAQISAENIYKKSSEQTIEERANESFDEDTYLNEIVVPIALKELGGKEFYMYTYSAEREGEKYYYTAALTPANDDDTIYKFTLTETERCHSEKTAENFENIIASLTIDETASADASNSLGISLDLPAKLTDKTEDKSEITFFASDTVDGIQISVYSAGGKVSSETIAEKSRARNIEYLNDEYVNISDITPISDASYGEKAFTYSIAAVSEKMWNEYFCFFEKGSYCYMIDIIYTAQSADLPDEIMASLSVEELDAEKYGTMIPSNFYALFPEQAEYKINYDGITSFDLPSAWWVDDNSADETSYLECIVGTGMYILGGMGDIYTPEAIQLVIDSYMQYGATELQPFEYKKYGENTVYIGTLQTEDSGVVLNMTMAFTKSCMFMLMDYEATYGGQTMTDFENILSSFDAK